MALPDTPLDPSSAQEGRLIAAGLPYLRQVFASRHWRVYRVLDPTPLASGPGALTSHGRRLVRAARPLAGELRRARALQPLLDARARQRMRRAGARRMDGRDARPARPGRRAARFSLARAFASGPACSAGAGAGGVGTNAVASVTGHAATAPSDRVARRHRAGERSRAAIPLARCHDRCARVDRRGEPRDRHHRLAPARALG